MAKSAESPVYVFCGDDEPLRRDKLAAARQHFLAGDDPALALNEYDGESPSLTAAEVLDDVRTLPFLARRRIVIVHKADPFITRWRAELEAYLDDPGKGVLLLSAKTFPANTRLAKRIDEAGGTRRCERPKGRRELMPWLEQRAAKAHGKPLGAGAAEALLDAVGEEPGLLEAELDKLAVYVGDRPGISAADVETLVGENRTAAVFELSDALGSGNPGKAFEILASMFAGEKGAAFMLVGYLAKHLRRLSAGRAVMDARGDERSICKAAGYPFVMSGFVQQVRRFDRNRLRAARRKLAEADLTLKSRPDEPRQVLEQWVCTVAGLRR